MPRFGGRLSRNADALNAATSELESDKLLTGAEPKPLNKLDDLKNQDFAQDIVLKRIVAAVALGLMIGQVITADVVFVNWASHNHWRLSTAAMDAWLSATVVEVIGIVLVVARYLFPRRDKDQEL